MIFPADNPLTVEGIALGRKLFYEKALSDDYSMSCATCHQQEFAFTDPRVVSLGTDGTPGRRNSMAIMNPARTICSFGTAALRRLRCRPLGPWRTWWRCAIPGLKWKIVWPRIRTIRCFSNVPSDHPAWTARVW
ncbi:MAG: cytochrome-c peroxidase [Flavobacteriales bacterium]|nr:cytochrome-c peroxidase [Flavobacteriales bacterium]